MDAEFTNTTLGALLQFSNGRSSPERSDGWPYAVYGSNGIIGYANESNADVGSIVIGRVGSYCGSLYMCKQRCWVTDNAIRANAIGDNDPIFLYYLLTTLSLNNLRAGSGQPLLNQEILSSIPASIPDPSEQQAIANILGALDDKIELNGSMNQTLEAMARAIFKSYFVDFDPVRAKAEGRDTALPSDLAALFPDRFEDSELGEIPQGWKVAPLSEICENIYSGGTPSTENATFWAGNIPWLSSGETRSHYIITTEKTITPEGVSNSSTRMVRAGTTVIASAGQGHTRGQTSLLTFDCYINQSIVALVADTKVISDLYLFYDLVRRYEQFRQLSDSHSSRGSLTTKLLAQLRVCVPSSKVIAAFDQVAQPIVKQICQNLKESRILAALRDALLPRLLSGKIRVHETN